MKAMQKLLIISYSSIYDLDAELYEPPKYDQVQTWFSSSCIHDTIVIPFLNIK